MRFRGSLCVAAIVVLASCRHTPAPRTSAVTSEMQPYPDDPNPVLEQYLHHPGFTWKCNKTPHFQLCYQPKSAAERSIKDLEIIAEGDRDSILQMIDVKDYEPRIYMFFLNSRKQMKKLIGFYGDGRARPSQHVTFFVIDRPRTLAHEQVHEITTNLWGAAEPWIEEGVAVYITETHILDGDCKALLRSNRLMPLDQLVNAHWVSSQYSPDVTYTELGCFTKFLSGKYGIKKIREVWEGGAASVEKVFGKPLSELEQEWLTNLRQQPNTENQ